MQDGDYAPEMDLEEIYFAAETNKSKKLRFLECWMKQMKNSSECCQIKPNKLEEPSNVDVEVNVRPEGSRQELVLHACVSSAEEAHTSVPINQEGSSFSCLGDGEAYLRTIPQKIEQGLCSKEVDLWNLERLVGLSIGALNAKFRSNGSNDSFGNEVEDASEVNVHLEVSRLLLVKPKDLMLKYKISSSAPLHQISVQRITAQRT